MDDLEDRVVRIEQYSEELDEGARRLRDSNNRDPIGSSSSSALISTIVNASAIATVGLATKSIDYVFLTFALTFYTGPFLAGFIEEVRNKYRI